MQSVPAGLVEEASVSTRRRRELYKYFLPPGSAFSTSQSTVPDSVLTAHAQLVAWRLNCQRAMVSLIDQDIQYFVAEASKTLHLEDNTLYDEPLDAIWAGCVAVPKAGRLCEHTIAQLQQENGDPAYFEVVDLTQDNRFKELPFVTAEPFFKYYCGVPLRTRNGTPIGSLFALDDKVRGPINRTDRLFLAKMAENVMTHYESVKEREDRRRVLGMNSCLAAFVDPENQIKNYKKRHRESHQSMTRDTSASMQPLDGYVQGHDESMRKTSHRSRRSSRHDSDNQSDGSASTRQSRRVEEDDNIETFKRAANLLHAALSLDFGGGVVFMDTATSYRSRHQQRKTSDESSMGGDSEQEAPFRRRGSLGAATLQSSSSWGPPRPAGPPQMTPARTTTADILAAVSTPNIADVGAKSKAVMTPLVHEDLASLIRRHPRGKFYDLDPDASRGGTSSSDDAVYDMPRSKATPSKKEVQLLAKHFPGARQVIFLPLWDSTASRFSTLFAYTTSDFRSFSSNPDFLYCIAFASCVMTEITRIATLAADQQKSDFIGSVSHELRSPLHGILASCEFLCDTTVSTFQQSLIDTADSCARTLLDTINMVLDYSKINAFERNARKVRRKGGEVDTALTNAGQSQLNLFGNVDLANITEEVVEGVATGQVFKDSLTGVDAIDLADPSRQSFSGRKEVEIILDISPRANPKDWVFVTQPGAFRRIIMNIFGNALKYTRKGYIRVKLEAQSARRASGAPGSEESLATFVKLTITDTGQGMSPQFMRTKLYTPFAQENSIAPGTGLGLSLVKSMVTMLNGEINIQSTQNVGTEVSVIFPMTLSTPSNSSDSNSGSTPTSAGSIERVKDESLLVVQKKAPGRRALQFPDSPSGSISEATRMVRHAINRYLTGWYGFDVAAPFSVNNLPDVIITDESDLQDLLKILPGNLETSSSPMIIVLCTAASRKSDKTVLTKSARIEAVSHPFGPFKLARSIKWCLEKLERSLVTETEAEIQATASAEKEKQAAVDQAIIGIDHLTLQSTDPEHPNVNIIRAGSMAANEDSVHAQLVVDSSTDSSSSAAHMPDRTDFPFPHERPTDGTISPSTLEAAEKDRPPLSSRKTISPTRPEIRSQHADAATPMSSKGTLVAATTFPRPASAPAPRLLLVDDNKVNLRLLQTFMKKRRYTDVFSAEDGAQAVSVYRDLITEQPPRPPDIIFMDISMPVMNGFQATREIREIEQEFREQFPNPMKTPPSALIIALTGLASGRDQSEAFTSGFDLFLTKPTSFREVGRLLDNWEKSGNTATVGVPHGPVTGEPRPASEDEEGKDPQGSRESV